MIEPGEPDRIDRLKAEAYRRLRPLGPITGTRTHRLLKHPAGAPVILLAVLMLLGAVTLGIYAYQGSVNPKLRVGDSFIAIISHDDQRQVVPTNARTVGELLKRMNISVAKTDRVEPALDQPIATDNFLINIYRGAPIVIIDNGRETIVKSAAATPRSLINQSSETLYPEDRVTTHLTENFITQGTIGYRAKIDRATPVAMQLYGKPVVLRTHTKTVGALLKEKGIKLTSEDTVKPALETPITANLAVAVVRNGIQTITIEEDIPAPVQTVHDASLSFGSQAVRQEGSPGKMTNTYQVRIENGNEVSRQLLQSVKTKDPVTRIVARGSTSNVPADKQAVMAAAGVSPADYAYVDYIFSRESHWNAAVISANGRYAGLGQTNPATLSGACPNWQNDPVCQTRFFSNYANARYGGWSGAYSAWQTKGWW